MARFDDCLAVILHNEGGYVNDPVDPGGATNYGITQRTYDNYRDRRALARQTVRNISMAEVSDIYQSSYWQPTAAQLPVPLDLCYFDSCVNNGVGNAAYILREALGVALSNGAISTAEWEALSVLVAAYDPVVLATQFCDQRWGFFQSIVQKNPKMAKFINGWKNRLNYVRAQAGIPQEQ